jgi:hypothetical protein
LPSGRSRELLDESAVAAEIGLHAPRKFSLGLSATARPQLAARDLSVSHVEQEVVVALVGPTVLHRQIALATMAIRSSSAVIWTSAQAA